MSKSEYEQSLDFLLKVFNSFTHHAINWLRQGHGCSQQLEDVLSVWIHPKGIPNLIKTITLHYQTAVPFPDVPEQQELVLVKKEIDPSAIIHQPAFLDLFGDGLCPKKLAPNLVKSHRIGKTMNFDQELEEDDFQEESEMEEGGNLHVNESSFNESDGRAYKRGPYKSYSMGEKLQAVELFTHQELSITEISRSLGIPCKNIKRWATEGVFRKRGGGRRRTNPGLEEEVYRWLSTEYSLGDKIPVESVQEYALSRSSDPLFKASRGWAIKFIDRFGLRSRYSML